MTRAISVPVAPRPVTAANPPPYATTPAYAAAEAANKEAGALRNRSGGRARESLLGEHPFGRLEEGAFVVLPDGRSRSAARHEVLGRRPPVILASRGLEPDTDQALDEQERKALIIEVEESLGDEHLYGQTLSYLRSCSRMRVDRNCVNFIAEAKVYTYDRKQRGNDNYREEPRDWIEARHRRLMAGFDSIERYNGRERDS